MKKLNVLIVGATMAPLVKVGGLADVMESLPPALKKRGVKVTSLIPYYDSIKKEKGMKLKGKETLSIPFYGETHDVVIHHYHQGGGKADVLLVEDPHFFKEGVIYPIGYVPHTRIKKEDRRFSFFALAAASYIANLQTPPDVVHVHDWHSALVPFLLKQLMKNPPRTLLTIHNLAFQGIFPKKHVERLLGMPMPSTDTTLNFMKTGIEHADTINTVSPTYAKEIVTPTFGEGLHTTLHKRKKDLFGIVNGINLTRFNPVKDSLISARYSPQSHEKGKKTNKKKLLKMLDMTDTDMPVFGMVSRLFEQKGLSILNPLIPEIVNNGGRVIILGSGDTRYEKKLKALSKKYKEVGVRIGFDAALAQQIYAGSDFFLMPSKFEPCGLGQMIAMRYGTLPIVRATGGLKDTVKGTGTKANGVVFSDFSQIAMQEALNEAFSLYANPAQMKKRIKNAFTTDFSWDKSARKYVTLYTRKI